MLGYNCQKCGAVLRHTSKLVLTSYPIDRVMECPECGTEHYLLVDRVLCTADEYEKRISRYYEMDV